MNPVRGSTSKSCAASVVVSTTTLLLLLGDAIPDGRGWERKCEGGSGKRLSIVGVDVVQSIVVLLKPTYLFFSSLIILHPVPIPIRGFFFVILIPRTDRDISMPVYAS
ncbi:hypothetical protein C8R41DRAFT_861590 [Lentinula lateritia]|uniref:Uncharacterized protein n=1 Tax=Lentinula lateritia TaxID=40482 RepID=A0ABQ8UXP2_9AGAR|nr:hypothetical protein C8R41DRAFT_861590 [Lentinula lateritia]